MTSKETSIVDQAMEKSKPEQEPLPPSQQDAHFGHKLDADKAFFAVKEQPADFVLDDATNKRLLGRIDMILMPILCLVYALNYLDKTTLSYASVTGMQMDIGLKGHDYQWLGSIFYFGYLGFEFPAIRLLQRLPLAKYSGFCIIAWGVTLACFSTVQNFAGAVTIRLFLGIFEASVSPAWTLFTAQWYTKKEQSVRVAFWIGSNGLAQIFGGSFAYGIAHHSAKHQYTLAPWRIIYLFTGLLTILVGLIFLFIVPDSQLNARWLSESDRILAIERVRINQQGIGNKTFKLYQLKEALTDPITWAFFAISLIGDIPNGGLSNFFSLLIKSFGYTAEQSLLYGCISGAIQIVILVAWGYVTQLYGNRILVSLGTMGVAILGSVLLVALPIEEKQGRLAGFYLSGFFVVALSSCISLMTSNVAGYTKKTTVAGLFFIAYCIGNVIGPQTFPPSTAPRYLPAEITLIVCYSICALDLLYIYWYYVQANKRKEVARNTTGYVKFERQEFFDLTDKENPEFIYEM